MFKSVKELTTKIDTFISRYNERCKSFAWTATADSILQKVARLCGRINGTEH
ncbi:Mobile element protein [plant metagenome]|uniref:Mobile element protein n=1 Tax=plant metagenome TaxID=1297885 RepID=A0A484SRN6_9ZZZZ